MRVLVTGGTGFIGRNLVAHLQQHEVLAPTSAELDLLDQERVTAYLQQHAVDVVVHAAGVGGSRKHPQTDVLKCNLQMFFNLASNRSLYRKLIFLGSGAAYDKRRDIINAKENEDQVPADEYGLSKYVCSQYIQASEHMIDLRLFGVFGKYEDPDVRFPSNIACRILFDLPVEMHQNMLLDYVDVRDVCAIVEHFIVHEAKHKVYNIGPDEHTDLLAIAQTLQEIAGKRTEIMVKKEGMNREYTCSNARIKQELSFTFTPLRTALSDLYAWYEERQGGMSKEGLLKY